ncbi:chaperone NapD [Ferrimonas pelagia]|uniref:Chaperone NapD n=1 Tax=Ferrimonas pelagia TaxID=1177826 RepID=A0ABP9FBR5_9GAMM
MTEHICSLVLSVMPPKRTQVEAAVEALDGASVAVADPSGKLVVLLEHSQQQAQVDCIDTIKGLPGVSATTLIYHQELENV